MSFLRDYLAAVRSSTRVPVSAALGHWMPADATPPPTASAHQPGVGWLVGIVGCATFALVGLVLPANVFGSLAAAVFSTMATALFTGGMNERGLAQAAERSAASLGVFALMLVTLAKLSLLAMLAVRSPAVVLAALLAGHVVSRFWPLLNGRALSRRTWIVAGAWCAAALAIGVFAQGVAFALVGVVFSGLAWWAARRWVARAARSGDANSAGAMQQLCEAAFYLGAAIGAGVR